MAVNSIYGSNYSISDSKYTNTNNTESATSTDKSSNDVNSSKTDSYTSSLLSQLNSSYLNYSANGLYSNPTLADFLHDTDSSSEDNLFSILDSSTDNSSSDQSLASILGGTDSDDNSENNAIDSAFSSIADEISAKDTELINNALANMAKKSESSDKSPTNA